MLTREEEDMLLGTAEEIRESFPDSPQHSALADQLEAAARSGDIHEVEEVATRIILSTPLEIPIRRRRYLSG